MNAVLLSLATFFSTLVGRLLALKFRDRLHFVLSFTAGVLLGVVSFDILPEIFALAREHEIDAVGAMVALVVGFLLFHGLEKVGLIHRGHETDYPAHHRPQVGVLSALALAGHSFMDGVAIGLAFQVSPAVGMVVAGCVIFPQFSDRLDTARFYVALHKTTPPSFSKLLIEFLTPPSVGDAALSLPGSSAVV